MTRFAKLPLALLAVLAMLFLMPGLARADDTTAATGSATDSSAAATSSAADSSAAATSTGTDSGAATSTATESSAPATSMSAQQNAVVPDAAPALPPCPDLAHVTDCIPPCAVEPFKSSPLCTTTLPPPPPACQKLSDLPHCTPSCAFLAHVLHQDGFCTKLPHCLPGDQLPPGFPTIPGIPVCRGSGSTTPPTTSPGGVFYKNCTDARAHGASNIHRGQPGYRKALDRDNDGIACESSTSTGTPQTPKAPTPKPQPAASPVVHQLAYTGAVPTPVALAGFGLVLGGAGLLRLSRRTR